MDPILQTWEVCLLHLHHNKIHDEMLRSTAVLPVTILTKYMQKSGLTTHILLLQLDAGCFQHTKDVTSLDFQNEVYSLVPLANAFEFV